MNDTTKDVLHWQVETYGWHIGDYTYGGPDVKTWGEGAILRMGRFCSIGPGVTIFLGGNHRTDWVTTYPFNIRYAEFGHITGHPHTNGDVVIGNDVWLAADCTILSGVKIGDGAVIAAGSVVSRDVEPFAIVAGNPGRTVKRRFPDAHIDALLAIGWWNYDLDEIRHLVPLLQSGSIADFIDLASATLKPKSV